MSLKNMLSGLFPKRNLESDIFDIDDIRNFSLAERRKENRKKYRDSLIKWTLIGLTASGLVLTAGTVIVRSFNTATETKAVQKGKASDVTKEGKTVDAINQGKYHSKLEELTAAKKKQAEAEKSAKEASKKAQSAQAKAAKEAEKEDLANTKADNETLKSTVDQNQTTIANLKSEKEVLTAEKTQLQKENDDLKSKASALENELKTLKDQQQQDQKQKEATASSGNS